MEAVRADENNNEGYREGVQCLGSDGVDRAFRQRKERPDFGEQAGGDSTDSKAA